MRLHGPPSSSPNADRYQLQISLLQELAFPLKRFSYRARHFFSSPVCLPRLAPSAQGICCVPDCLPSEPAGARCTPPAHQRTLEVVGLIKAQPDLVPEAAAALAHVGDAEAEAGQAGGAVLQVEVPVGAGTCGAAREWVIAGPRRTSPAPTPRLLPACPGAPYPAAG